MATMMAPASRQNRAACDPTLPRPWTTMRLPSRPGVRPSAFMSSATPHASRSAKYSPRPVASRRPRTPPSAIGLPVTHASASSDPGIERLIGVDDPRHLAFARAVVGRRHVDARADEVLLDQLVRVAARDALELFDACTSSDRSAPRPWRRRTADRRSRTCRSSARRAP